MWLFILSLHAFLLSELIPAGFLHSSTDYSDCQWSALSPTQQKHSGAGNWWRIEGKWMCWSFLQELHKVISFFTASPLGLRKGFWILILTAHTLTHHYLSSDWTEPIDIPGCVILFFLHVHIIFLWAHYFPGASIPTSYVLLQKIRQVSLQTSLSCSYDLNFLLAHSVSNGTKIYPTANQLWVGTLLL